MSDRYFGAWSSIVDVHKDFGIDDSDLRDGEVLVAMYEKEAYEGTACVLFERDGRLYEVNASHCSCYGLEGQWSPEETSWDALQMRKFGAPAVIANNREAFHIFGLLVNNQQADGYFR